MQVGYHWKNSYGGAPAAYLLSSEAQRIQPIAIRPGFEANVEAVGWVPQICAAVPVAEEGYRKP